MHVSSGILVALGVSSLAGVTNSPMPWLHGFTTSGVSDVLARDVSHRVERYARCDDCVEMGGIEVTASVVPGAPDATILATFSQGVVVVDGDGHLIATGPGYPPSGSADELLAVATGDAAIGTPVIAIAARRGGHRTSEVWLELYRVDSTAKLARLFAGKVEEHEDKLDRKGSVTFVPGGLIHRAPRSQTADLWQFDSHAGRYLYSGALDAQPSREREPRRDPASTPVAVLP